MSIHTLSLSGNLSAIGPWAMPGGAGPSIGQVTAVTMADLAAIYLSAVDDGNLAAILQNYSLGGQAVIATATTANGNAQATSVTARGSSPLPVSQIKPLDVVLGLNIPVGTYVVSTAAGGATVNMSQNATGTTTGLIFVREAQYSDSQSGPQPTGQLFIPNRGWLKILPGDYIAVDNTGFPILLGNFAVGNAAAATGYTASQWTFT